MQRNLLALNGRVFPVVVDLLVTYRAMRDFVVHDRSDPSLAEVRDVLLEAVRGRQDFYEGHVLLALCEAYLGDRVQAREHLDRASFLTGRPFFDWPMSDDMYLAHVLLGESDKVVTWAKWVDEVNEERKTSTRCWIVALHNATSCKDHSAAEWFDRCERKLKRSAKKAKEPLKVPAPVAGEWALFLLTCPNEKLRYVQQAQMLLEKVPPLESAWQVLRARAALAAQQGDWPRAVAEIQGCLERAPVSLRTELEAQVAAYESQQVWTRQRP